MSLTISWRNHRPPDIELGDNHALWYVQWHPDYDLNPQYKGISPVARYCANVEHLTPKGEVCLSTIHFDTPEVVLVDEATRRYCESIGLAYKRYPVWQVQCWEPLTLTPSLLCTPPPEGHGCGDHGYIRNGRWERA